MHMRGAPPTFSDTMHLILAINPFVLLSITSGVAVFRNWFRFYSILTILIVVALATLAFSYVPAAPRIDRRHGWGSVSAAHCTFINSGTLCWPSCCSEARDPAARK